MINASGFKYTSDSQGVCDMVISLNNGVVSDGTHKNPLTKFNPVVITSQHDGRQYAAVGFATGEIDSRSASEIWPNWAGDNTVHRVDFLDRLLSCLRVCSNWVVHLCRFIRLRKLLPGLWLSDS